MQNANESGASLLMQPRLPLQDIINLLLHMPPNVPGSQTSLDPSCAQYEAGRLPNWAPTSIGQSEGEWKPR